MRRHYAIAKFDDLGRLRALKVRIEDTMYIASPHDHGKGERELYIDIDTVLPVGPRPPPGPNTERLAQVNAVIQDLKKKFSR